MKSRAARALRGLARRLLALAERLDPTPQLTPEEAGRRVALAMRDAMFSLSEFMAAFAEAPR